jgi:hypothetical protein
MQRVLGTIALLMLIVGLGLYAAGWLSWDNTTERATIEIETGEIKRATEEAVEKGKEFVEESIDSVRSDQDPPVDSQGPDRPEAVEVEVEPVEPVVPR